MYKILQKKETVNFGNRFKITKVLVETPTKRKVEFYLREASPFSIIIPFLNKEKVIMVRQHRIGANKMSLEFPSGIVGGKSPKEVAIQELKEETGYRAKKMIPIASFYISPGWSTQEGNVFVAEELVAGEQTPEPDEFIEVKEIKFKDIEDLIKKKVIFDAPTITAFYYYSQYASGKLRRKDRL